MQYDSAPETPIFELAEELVESWRGITKCTAEFLRAVGESASSSRARTRAS